MGIQTPPKRELLEFFQWGLDTLTPFGHRQRTKAFLLPPAFFVEGRSLRFRIKEF
jgi:hypothetical protein